MEKISKRKLARAANATDTIVTSQPVVPSLPTEIVSDNIVPPETESTLLPSPVLIPTPVLTPTLLPTPPPALMPSANSNSIEGNTPVKIDVVQMDITTPANAELTTPPSMVKERKRRIIVDDDDESPTFNPMARGKKRTRGRGRGTRRGGLQRFNQRRAEMLASPDKSHDATIFTSPEVSSCHKHTNLHLINSLGPVTSYLLSWYLLCLQKHQ